MNVPVRDKPDRAKAAAGFDKGAFFRLSRMLHAYLSAFAFLALFFFSATGILLNHPEWFETYQPAEHKVAFALTPAELTAAKASKDRGRALAAAAAHHASLPGAYASADIDGGQALVRLEGPKGAADLTIDLSAWLVLALSLIGYVLFFSLRFRLKTSLILTAVSLAVLLGIAWLLVP